MVDLSIVMLVYQRIQRAFWDVNPTPWNSGECWLLPISGVDGSLGVQDEDDPDQRVDVHGVVFLSETDRYGISVTKTWSLTNTNCFLRTDFCGLKKNNKTNNDGRQLQELLLMEFLWWSLQASADHFSSRRQEREEQASKLAQAALVPPRRNSALNGDANWCMAYLWMVGVVMGTGNSMVQYGIVWCIYKWGQ